MSEHVRVSVDLQKIADLLYPESRSNAMLYRLSHFLSSPEMYFQVEEFIASSFKLMAKENDELRETVVRMAMNSANPVKFVNSEVKP